MKTSLLSFVVSIFCFNAFAQDIILKRNGGEQYCTVLKVTGKEVKYQKLGEPNGGIFSIYKDEILRINYEDGRVDTFANRRSRQAPPRPPKPPAPPPPPKPKERKVILE